MKKVNFVALLFFCLVLIGCDSRPKDEPEIPFVLEGISPENYPKTDASTSAEPLQTLIACKLLEFRYEWQRRDVLDNVFFIYPNYEDVPEGFYKHFHSTGTHTAFMNLIDKEVDFIITARKASEDELAHAGQLGVKLIETPIALDAFIFLTHLDNGVKSLTTEQIQRIYTGEIKNWQEVGAKNSLINPYVRNANSGSQELMESLVMKDKEIVEWPEAILTGMMGPFSRLREDADGLCYTVYYFKEKMVRDKIVNHIAVDGIYPDKKSIQNRTYPYTTEVYAVIRSDEDRSSMAHKIYDLLQTEAGKKVIEESGYVAY